MIPYRQQTIISTAAFYGSWCIVIVLLISTIILALTTLHWKLIGDPPVYNYIGWLMTKGQVPYRDIFDFCLFGTYAVHYFVVKFIGETDSAWRTFDLLCLAFLNILIFLYCSHFSRLAALAAAALFSALHLYNGPLCSGQKDYVLLVFLMAGTYFFQKYSYTPTSPLYLLLSGLFLGAGITIKPFVIFWCALILLATLLRDFRNRHYRCTHYALYIFSCGAPLLIGIFLLWQTRALKPFFDILLNYIGPLYPKMELNNIILLLRERLLGIPLGVMIVTIFLIGIIDLLTSRHTDRFRALLLYGMLYGAFHYVLQRKGLLYHMYPLFLFMAQLVGSWFAYAKTKQCSVRNILILSLALYYAGGLAYTSAKNVFVKPAHYFDSFPFEEMLMCDLAGRVPENETVQSMDVMSGTINICFRLHIMKATRFIHDTFFYFQIDHPYVQGLRREFIHDLQKNKPLFITLSRGGWPVEGFDRIKLFPELEQFIQEHYVLDRERERYRIYKRKDVLSTS